MASLWVGKFGGEGTVAINTSILPHCQIPKCCMADSGLGHSPSPVWPVQARSQSLPPAGSAWGQDMLPSLHAVRLGLGYALPPPGPGWGWGTGYAPPPPAMLLGQGQAAPVHLYMA